MHYNCISRKINSHSWVYVLTWSIFWYSNHINMDILNCSLEWRGCRDDAVSRWWQIFWQEYIISQYLKARRVQDTYIFGIGVHTHSRYGFVIILRGTSVKLRGCFGQAIRMVDLDVEVSKIRILVNTKYIKRTYTHRYHKGSHKCSTRMHYFHCCSLKWQLISTWVLCGDFSVFTVTSYFLKLMEQIFNINGIT